MGRRAPAKYSRVPARADREAYERMLDFGP